MNFDKNKLGREWIPYTIGMCSAVVLYLVLSRLGFLWGLLQQLFGYVSPVFGGIVIAYVVDTLVVAYEKTLFKKVKKRKVQRALAITVAIITILAFLALISVALIPQLVGSVSILLNGFSGYVQTLSGSLHETTVWEIGGIRVDLSSLVSIGEQLIARVTGAIQESIPRILNTSVNIGKGFFDLVINCILAIYFLFDKDRLRRNMKAMLRRHLSPEKYRRLAEIGTRSNAITIRYIAFDLLDGCIVGVANFIFQTVFGIPYAALISVVVGVANLVPTFGPIVGGAIGAFILLLVSPGQMVWFIIFTWILQTLDGYVLKPVLYGDSFGIAPLWVLICVIVGGRVFGIAGILLSIPFAAISDFLYRDFLERRENAAQETAEKETQSAE